MSAPDALAVATGALVDAGLKATLVFAGAALATRVMARRSAAERHAVWATAFAAVPVLVAAAAARGADVAWELPWLPVLWAAGTLAALAPLLRGLAGLHRVQHRARRDPVDPRLFWSDTLPGPATWGALRPVILMPRAARGWSPARREAALAHERAHVARGDWGVHLFAWAMAALLWWNPLAWLARHRLAEEAERAADDVVLGQGVQPSEYAALLLSLARTRSPAAALGALGPGSLVGRRIHAVLDPRPRRAGRRLAALLALTGLLATAPTLGAWALWTRPADAPLTCLPGPTP